MYILTNKDFGIDDTNSYSYRTHPDLIDAITQAGEEASGSCAKIKIIEIPDGVQYEIDEYDGLETVHEIHRRWD